jgi:uncharacterized protein
LRISAEHLIKIRIINNFGLGYKIQSKVTVTKWCEVLKQFYRKCWRQTNPWKTLDEIKRILSSHKRDLQVRYPISEIGIFGSVARGEATPVSDVDILVKFSAPIGLDFVSLADELEDLLCVRVDLVSDGAIKPRMLLSLRRAWFVSKRDGKQLLLDILESIGKIQTYTAALASYCRDRECSPDNALLADWEKSQWRTLERGACRLRGSGCSGVVGTFGSGLWQRVFGKEPSPDDPVCSPVSCRANCRYTVTTIGMEPLQRDIIFE